jgi:hypothetical protein
MITMMASTRMRWAGQVARIGEISIEYKIFVGKKKNPFGRSGHRWKDSIKMTLREG